MANTTRGQRRAKARMRIKQAAASKGWESAFDEEQARVANAVKVNNEKTQREAERASRTSYAEIKNALRLSYLMDNEYCAIIGHGTM